MKDEETFIKLLSEKGPENQMTVAIEEMAELIKELTRSLRGKTDVMHICEEMADVEIVMKQLKILFPDSKKLMPMFTRFKMDRLKNWYLDNKGRK
jgi:hypothetical protein